MIQVKDKQYYLENVCANCPGTLRGQTTICKMHSLHIGKIESCPEWEHHDTPSFKNHDGQLAFFDLEPAMEIVQKVEEDLKDYHWMIREINRLEDSIWRKEQLQGSSGSSLTAQYGLEATMPKAQGARLLTDLEVEEIEKMVKRKQKLEDRVYRIQQASTKITDEKERTVLDCMLDGMRMKAIARHVGISRTRLNEIKRDLVPKLAWELYPEELKGN
jgi:DNA-binding CsgD family transcriptional regulator